MNDDDGRGDGQIMGIRTAIPPRKKVNYAKHLLPDLSMVGKRVRVKVTGACSIENLPDQAYKAEIASLSPRGTLAEEQ